MVEAKSISNNGIEAPCKDVKNEVENGAVKVNVKVKILHILSIGIWTFSCGFLAYSCRPVRTSCDLQGLLYEGLDQAIVGDKGKTEAQPQSIGVVTSTGKEYYLDQSKNRNWRDAFNYCAAFGMQLATIESNAEAELLQEKLYRKLFSEHAWLAGVVNRTIEAFGWNLQNGESSTQNAKFMTLVHFAAEHEHTTCLSLYPRKDECPIGCWAFQRDCQKQLATLCEKMVSGNFVNHR